MILMLDNYDSFVYNLYQLIGTQYPRLKVIRNDSMPPEAMEALLPKALVISPGPGHPREAGYSMEAIRYFAGKIPILGICLGHQAICEAFGGTVSYAGRLMHGKSSQIKLQPESPLLAGLGNEMTVARYHSLCAKREGLPDCLEVVAESDEGEIMALAHREYPIYGLQFHPESVLTPKGAVLIHNFLRLAGLSWQNEQGEA